MEIALGIPGRTWSYGFGRSMLALQASAAARKVKLHFMQETSSDLYINRNLSVCPLIGKDADGKPVREIYPTDLAKWQPYNGKLKPDRVFWIDTDMVFEPEDFWKLVEHDVDFVSGVCMSGPNDIALGYWNKTAAGASYVSNLPRYKVLSTNQVLDSFSMWVEDKRDERGLCRVDHTGLAFVCTKLNVYERLGYPYFRTVVFPWGDTPVQLSEDVGFCQRCGDAGIELYVDPAVLIGHQKMTELRVQP